MTDLPFDDDAPREDLDALLRDYERGLAALETAASQDLERQVELRQELAKRLALDRRLLRLYDEVKFLSEARRAHLEAMGCVVVGQEIHGADRATIVRLTLNRHPYVLTFKEPPPSQEEVEAELELAPGEGQPVFSIRLVLDASEPGSGWSPRQVDAFVPGAWVTDLLTFSSQPDRPAGPPGSGSGEDRVRTLKERFGLT